MRPAVDETDTAARAMLVTALLVALVAPSSCTTTPNAESPAPTAATVELFYATDRNRTGSSEPAEVYGSKRGKLGYGVCEVTFPVRDSRSGVSDPSLWSTEYDRASARRVALRTVTPLEEGAFFQRVTERVRGRQDGSVLLYVHGYSRDFKTAAEDAATLTYELGYRGTSVLYSWPSEGSLSRYLADANNVQWTGPHLRHFLEAMALRAEADVVHVVAHSMGNRALVDALIELRKEGAPQAAWRLGEIVLLAPDLDREIFRRDQAPRLGAGDLSLTLYVSGLDVPLRASKALSTYPRLGDASSGVAVIAGIETIDVTEATQITSGHGYYKESPRVMADLHYLLNERMRAHSRTTLRPVETSVGSYWVVRP
jgi:esterase/lipase superfamily enzyme